MPLHQQQAESFDAPASPPRYLAILVLHQAIEDAAGRGPHLTLEEHEDAVRFVAGDWRCQLWADAAGVLPELVRQAAMVAAPRPRPTRVRRLTAETVRQIRADAVAGVPRRELRQRYGLGKNTLWDILTGRTWREVRV